MQEIWKSIKGFEGRYEVSDKGRVKSLERVVMRNDGRKQIINERILKGRPNTNGYLMVALYDDKSKQKSCCIHRLVCETFIEPVEGKNEVNHKDEDKTNNAVCNLEWCTRKENINYGTRNQRTSKPVAQFTKSGEFVKLHQSVHSAGRSLGIYYQNICACANGRTKTAYGFIWKHV